MTPTLARMVAAHARNYKKPLKWFAIPQLFRYERQQKGRLREHFQFNADIFGESSPAADAELIALLIDSLRELRLTSEDFVVRLSSRNAWHEFFQRETRNAERGTEDEEAFYQVIDKLEREDVAESDRKLQALGFTLDAVKGFIAAAQPTAELDFIVRDLAARGLAEFVKVDYGVIRGLAYYTGPVFEAFDRQGEFRAIAGGGRYDGLVKRVSGGKVDLPGLGFGMGDVVLTELLRARGRLPDRRARLGAFFLIEDETLRKESLGLIQRLRDSNSGPVDFPLAPAKPDKQFKRVQEILPAATLRLERTSASELLVRVLIVASREERTFPLMAVDELVKCVAEVNRIATAAAGEMFFRR
jgi:histidyl-tRNA synthetase